ncbi:hypothetical protein BGZ92_011343 [Podila epicladia]|nr:hypothetical protein BGZ92_011343 [Podila epicladia]
MDYENIAGGTLKFKGGGGISKKKKKKTDASKVKATLDSESPAAKPVKLIEKTAAELKFEEVQKKRELNRKLEEMTEHYDIPKVGPG